MVRHTHENPPSYDDAREFFVCVRTERSTHATSDSQSNVQKPREKTSKILIGAAAGPHIFATV